MFTYNPGQKLEGC